MLIEKRYTYDVDVTFFKKILDPNVYAQIKEKEDNKLLKRGEYFQTSYGTIIVYVGNNHNWIHIGKKLLGFLQTLSGKEITLVGGADSECLLDIETTAKVQKEFKYFFILVVFQLLPNYIIDKNTYIESVFVYTEQGEMCPREESNLHLKFRKLPSYPLNDEGL